MICSHALFGWPQWVACPFVSIRTEWWQLQHFQLEFVWWWTQFIWWPLAAPACMFMNLKKLVPSRLQSAQGWTLSRWRRNWSCSRPLGCQKNYIYIHLYVLNTYMHIYYIKLLKSNLITIYIYIVITQSIPKCFHLQHFTPKIVSLVHRLVPGEPPSASPGDAERESEPAAGAKAMVVASPVGSELRTPPPSFQAYIR